MSKQSWRGSTLLNPEPPVLVSCGGLENPNLITIGWTGTICTQPSMVSISVRPERFSHHLIQESGQFAINLPTEALVRSVDWCGVKSGRDVDKFAACGLHAEPGSVLTDCPVLAESPVNLECKVTQMIPLGSHDLFLAEVVACDVDESLLDETGKLCLDKAKLIVYSHGEYLALGKKLGTFGYTVRKKKPARKKKKPQKRGAAVCTAARLFCGSVVLMKKITHPNGSRRSSSDCSVQTAPCPTYRRPFPGSWRPGRGWLPPAGQHALQALPLPASRRTGSPVHGPR